MKCTNRTHSLFVCKKHGYLAIESPRKWCTTTRVTNTLIKHNKTKITTTSSTEEIEEFDDALGESLQFPEATDVL